MEKREVSLSFQLKQYLDEHTSEDVKNIEQLIETKRKLKHQPVKIFAALIPELNNYTLFYLAFLSKLKNIVGAENFELHILICDFVLPIDRRNEDCKIFENLFSIFFQEKIGLNVYHATSIMPGIVTDEDYQKLKLLIKRDELIQAINEITASGTYINLAAIDMWISEYFIASKYLENTVGTTIDGVLIGADKYKVYDLVRTKIKHLKTLNGTLDFHLPYIICVRRFFREITFPPVISLDNTEKMIGDSIIRCLEGDVEKYRYIKKDLEIMYDLIANILKVCGYEKTIPSDEQNIESKIAKLFQNLKSELASLGEVERVESAIMTKLIGAREYNTLFDLMKTKFNRYMLKLLYTKPGLTQADYARAIMNFDRETEHKILKLRTSGIPTTNVNNFFKEAQSIGLWKREKGRYFPNFKTIHVVVDKKNLEEYRLKN
jgi:hypothetical protein